MKSTGTFQTYLLEPGQAPSVPFFVASLTAGLVLGLLEVVVELSFAAMIFSGPLAAHFQSGIGYLLVGSVVFTVGFALLGAYRGVVAAPQDVPVVIIALMAAELASQMQETVSTNQLFASEVIARQVTQDGFVTVVVMIAITTVITGLFFFLIGAFRLGRLIRFIPYPVIGGFLAGTGWLVFNGGFSVMTQAPLSWSWDGLPGLFSAAELSRWLPALALGIALLLASRLAQHYLVLPGVILAGVAANYAWFAITGKSLEAVRAAGLLLGPFPEGGFWQPLSPAMLGQVQWTQFGEHQLYHILTLAVISLMALLLNAGGIELSTGRDVRLNRELKTAGLVNLFAGLVGSPTGYPSVSFSVLGFQLKAASRLLGLIVAAVCLAALVWGNTLLGLIPRAVMAGLLMFLGLSFLYEWLYEKWFTLSRSEYAIMLMIVFIIGVYGITLGVAFGIAAVLVMFVIRSSLNNPIHQTLSGAQLQSTVERAQIQKQWLQEHGNRVYIVKLRGFLFFGTSHMIYNNLSQRLNDSSVPLKYLILDFERVSDMDSSSEMSFAKLAHQAESNGIELLLVSLNPKLRPRLHTLLAGSSPIRTFEHLDDAAIWYEDHLLEALASGQKGEPSFDDELRNIFPDTEMRNAFKTLLVRQEIQAGQVLIERGSPAEHIYFVESGRLEVILQRENTPPLRLRTIQPGAMFGELAVYLEQPRTATVRAIGDCTLYALRKTTFSNLWRTHSELAECLNQHLLKILAQRLVHTSETIEHLMR